MSSFDKNYKSADLSYSKVPKENNWEENHIKTMTIKLLKTKFKALREKRCI